MNFCGSVAEWLACWTQVQKGLGSNPSRDHRRQRRRGCRGRDPQYLTCRGRPVLTTPQYFDKCFIFFPSAELLNTANRCHFHLQCAQCTVFNSRILKITHPECTISHHFEMKNSSIFWEGAQPLPRPHPSPPTAPRFSRLRRSTCDPQCSSGVDFPGRDAVG